MTDTTDTRYLITARAVTARYSAPVPDLGHYHVIAIQDRGGRSEYAHGFDELMTLTEAKQLVADMIRADAAVYGSQELYEQIKAEFSVDRLHELVSSNVNPGWEAIWIANCDHPNCVFDMIYMAGDFMDWQPYWTPSTDSRE